VCDGVGVGVQGGDRLDGRGWQGGEDVWPWYQERRRECGMHRVDVRDHDEGRWRSLERADGTIVWLVADYHACS